MTFIRFERALDRFVPTFLMALGLIAAFALVPSLEQGD